MLAAVKRYKLLLSGAFARYFPRTTAYLHAEREAAVPQKTPRARVKAASRAKKPTKPRAASPQSLSTAIYGPALMAVDEHQAKAMRERVGQAVAAGVISAPSDEQWAMILGRNPLTRIFAGAGSGKSTTLVLRVVFMLCHMRVEPGRLTVISFTNASCAQLREQLIQVLGFWSYPFDAAQARQCVRTFHSAMAVQAKALLNNPAWFEQLDDSSGAPREPDNPLTSARLRPAQQRVLKQAYQRCYAEHSDFRERVHRVLGLPLPCTEGKRVRIPKAPLDGFKLAGEFSAVPLFEAFYVQAGFMESIGIRLDRVNLQTLTCSAHERAFIEALLPFWATFATCLREQRLMTFNGAFQQLTQALSAGQEPGASTALAPFTHLLIDEFQDISPQIVQWLQAVQRRLAETGEAVSLMAIGDDWQSIYGWRGSSPELFMDFDKHFPGKGKAKKSAVLLLETNYRSIEPVIRDGEAVLADVAYKHAKTSKAFKAMQPGDHGVKVVQRFDSKTQLPELLRVINSQCAHVATRSMAERTAVLVLSRRNEPLQRIQAQLDSTLPVKAYTIHRAKGLQAEVAIIVDDCAPPEKHPLRNALYAYSGFFRNSYDQAMADESLRLAYVAITRGVSRVLWFTQKAQGATQVLLKRNGR
ncbi:DEAD/DEAH box helicase [Pseudomonas sp. UBA2684]|uniref:DEAD/DEAH box helicase n=1 Tax=Pseudomonas sp. UBA2684 TaxID=1947311 RepID=UPI000E987E78|nr:DEAD/DEAH box helicase [Pseudomonas sp. UBA2684]HBX56079.1 DNA helicase UvrD [Pseudomonas sp.]|tara:strand:+ start:4008 stop:5933 length:1926 start_codon:yes stop_codon:yes gene_type:complete